MLENCVVSLNRDGDWLFGNGGLQLGNRVGFDSGVCFDGDLSGELGILARSIFAGVGVIVLKVLGMLLGIDHSSA